MSVGAVQASFAATLVDEWLRRGLAHAVVCPGSRSTPLALALAGRPELEVHVRLDERSAGFYALGLGLATGRPALVLVTSGTAAAELHPAVVEAHQARVPLLVCTADRPPELQGVGAPQTIDQLHLFGPATRWFANPGVPEGALSGTWRPLAARALAEAVEGPLGPGPVHLNLAFRDPLVADPGPLPPSSPASPAPAAGSGPQLVGDLGLVARWSGRRGLVVAGAGCGEPEAVRNLAERLGWPVLADARSGLREPAPGVVAAGDQLLRSPAVRQALRPQHVLVLGAPWASRALPSYVVEAAGAGAEVVAVDPWWRWADPERLVTDWIRVEPTPWLRAAAEALGDPKPPPDWLACWASLEQAAQAAIEGVLRPPGANRERALNEPLLARALAGLLPPGATVVVASSMPVRDLEWFGPVRAAPPRVLANRGANGIDGTTSTAMGVAAASPGPVVALMGDLAFLHDVSALVRLGAEGSRAPCPLVVADNGGGGIFSFLAQARAVDEQHFEQLFGTPPATELAQVARAFGLSVTEVSTEGELEEALPPSLGRPGPTLLRVRVPGRAANVALHEELERAVGEAAALVLGG